MGHRGSLPWPMACEYRVCCKPDCQGALRIIKDDAESLVVEIHPDRCLLWYEPLLWLGSFKTVVLCKGIQSSSNQGVLPIPARSFVSFGTACIYCACIVCKRSIERYEMKRDGTLTYEKVSSSTLGTNPSVQIPYLRLVWKWLPCFALNSRLLNNTEFFLLKRSWCHPKYTARRRRKRVLVSLGECTSNGFA